MRRTAANQTASPGLGLLMMLRARLLRNRLTQVVNQSPIRLLLVIIFMAAIWGALYAIFDNAFVFMRRFEQSAVAIFYVFDLFFVAMTFLLAFSTAVLIYGGLFGRAEPSFLMAAPLPARSIVAVMFLEALFFASWSLLLLGVPLMMAIGHAQHLPWDFYLIFIVAFLGFVPIPGAAGLLVAMLVALWVPRMAKRVLFFSGAAVTLLAVLWWGRLWVATADDSTEWLLGFLAEFEYLKRPLFPPTWVANTIKMAINGQPREAFFYLGVTLANAVFFSWLAVNLVARKLLPAFGRAHSAPNRTRVRTSRLSRWLTRLAFFYLPRRMRMLILKDVRTFLRDPVQWSQLVILFGLMALYLAYLPRVRPEGFNVPWQGLICFLNYGAITLILSTFTSRFVFPMISLEGRQMWLVGLWPLSRNSVIWAKFFYAVTITALAALAVTALSIRALDLPPTLAAMQLCCTMTTCVGLCGLAVGLGARLPSFRETDSGRIASGLGGTVNLIASVVAVIASVGLFGGICYRMVGSGRLDETDAVSATLFADIILLGLDLASLSMLTGIRCFRRQEF